MAINETLKSYRYRECCVSFYQRAAVISVAATDRSGAPITLTTAKNIEEAHSKAEKAIDAYLDATGA